MRHVQCVVELPTGERIEAELVVQPTGAVVIRRDEMTIGPRAVKVVRVFAGCPVEILDEAILSGYYVLGSPKRIDQ